MWGKKKEEKKNIFYQEFLESLKREFGLLEVRRYQLLIDWMEDDWSRTKRHALQVLIPSLKTSFEVSGGITRQIYAHDKAGLAPDWTFFRVKRSCGVVLTYRHPNPAVPGWVLNLDFLSPMNPVIILYYNFMALIFYNTGTAELEFIPVQRRPNQA